MDDNQEVELSVAGDEDIPLAVGQGFSPADGSVDADKLADDSVITQKLADSAVTTDKIAGGAVTADKLAGISIVMNAQIDSMFAQIGE